MIALAILVVLAAVAIHVGAFLLVTRVIVPAVDRRLDAREIVAVEDPCAAVDYNLCCDFH